MFWTLMDSITEAVFSFGTYCFSLFETVGATSTIVTLSIIALFVGFVVLGSNGTSILGSIGSDRASRALATHADDQSRINAYYRKRDAAERSAQARANRRLKKEGYIDV